MSRTTTQLRQLYGPACSEHEVNQGFRDAWGAFNLVLEAFAYAARPADTAFRNCRRITGGSGYSLHAYFIRGVLQFWNWVAAKVRPLSIGVALDLNWKSNPYGARLVTDMSREVVEAILAIRTNGGHRVFRWGGYYSGNKDGMHWEIVASPDELATGIDMRTVRRKATSVPPPPPTPGAPAMAEFFAYDPNFLGGVTVAAGDIDGDGHIEIVTGAEEGGGPHVKVYRIVDGQVAELGGFMAYASDMTGGVNVTCAPGIIVTAPLNGGPHVKVFEFPEVLGG